MSLLLALPGSGALAQQGSEGQAAVDAMPASANGKQNPFTDTPCASDYVQMCTHTRGWRLGFDCLRYNYRASKLSEECADHTDEVNALKREQVLARQRAWQEACAEDIANHCSEFEKRQAIKGCLYRIRDQVAKECDEKLPYRPGYRGDGYAGWKDGSEPENFDEERAKKLRPRESQKLEDDSKLEEERARKRAEVRERIARNKQAAEQSAEQATDDADDGE